MDSRLIYSRNNTIPCHKSARGFTLIEVLIATSILAIIAMLSWRGIDHMVRTQGFTQQHSNHLLDMQTALSQWRADWDAAVPDSARMADAAIFDWNGRTLRLLRLAAPSQVSDLIQATQQQNQRSGAPIALTPGLQVVAWTLRENCPRPSEVATTAAADPAPDGPCWMRWQSPVLRTLGDQQTAWQQAASWATAAGSSTTARSSSQYITPLQNWKLAFHMQGSWVEAPVTAESTPTSSPAGASSSSHQRRGSSRPPPLVAHNGTDGSATAPLTAQLSGSRLPDAVRLQLTLPAHAVLSGDITVDWINPTYTRVRQ